MVLVLVVLRWLYVGTSDVPVRCRRFYNMQVRTQQQQNEGEKGKNNLLQCGYSLELAHSYLSILFLFLFDAFAPLENSNTQSTWIAG